MILKAKIFILNEKIGKEKQKSFSFPLFLTSRRKK